MDFRNILNTIDHLSEGIFDDDEIAAKNAQAQADYKQWAATRDTQHMAEIEKIKQLIDQYAKLKGVATESISISKELIESFGYTVNEGILGKLIPGVGSALSIKDAYDRWQQGDRSGAVISALSGIGYLIPGPMGWVVGGGLEAANELRDAGVNPADIISSNNEPLQQPVSSNTSPAAADPQEPTQENPTNSPAVLQTNLINAGYDIGSGGIDGKIGPNTAAAIQKFSKDYGFDNDIEAIAHLTGIDSNENLSESVEYNLLSENDKMKYALSLLDEAKLKIPKLSSRSRASTPKSKPSIAKRVLNRGISFLLKHPIISTIVASMAAYGIMVDDAGNLISSYFNTGSDEPVEQPVQQSGKSSEPASTRSNTKIANNPQLDSLAYQIDFALRNFTTAVSPAIQHQLDALKATWAYYK